MNEQYLQEYLDGKLNIDVETLSKEDKLKYLKQRDLLDTLMKEVNAFLFNLDKLQKMNKYLSEQVELE